jgi:hypothetical protein
MTTIEAKSLQLKELVAQYDTQLFFADIMGMMKTIPNFNFADKSADLYGLSSPMRQLFYLAGLNITSAPEKVTKSKFSDEEWTNIKALVQEIEKEYLILFDNAAQGKDEDGVVKTNLVANAFFNYFNQGHLNYEEQVLERIEMYFMPFAGHIEANFGFTPNEFIRFYDELGEVFHQKLNSFMAPGKQGNETWEDFVWRMASEGVPPERFQEHFPDHISNFFEFLYDHTTVFTFKSDEIKSLPIDKVNTFLNSFAIERTESEFLYYTQSNPIYERAIIKSGDNYIAFEHKQLGHAYYTTIANFLADDKKLGELFHKRRGKELENKIESVFNKLLDKSVKIYHSYYNEHGNEQDTLIIFQDTAFIIEAKASKRKEPLRDPDKAFPVIESNFNSVIQKGYDQAYRIKKFFTAKKPLLIYNKSGKLQETINTAEYKNVFSVIITLEKFGQLQTDLTDMLKMEKDDPTYPWSISIDDLEVLFLALLKLGVPFKKLVHHLNLRERLQGYLLCGDELQVFGWLLTNKKVDKSVKNLEKNDIPLLTTPEMADIYDKLYDKGLGFDNERQLQRKQSGQFIPFGG